MIRSHLKLHVELLTEAHAGLLFKSMNAWLWLYFKQCLTKFQCSYSYYFTRHWLEAILFPQQHKLSTNRFMTYSGGMCISFHYMYSILLFSIHLWTIYCSIKRDPLWKSSWMFPQLHLEKTRQCMSFEHV